MTVIRLTHNSVILKCAFCNGLGNSPSTTLDDDDYISDDPCPICKGTGVIIEYQQTDNLIDCALCDGTGHKLDEGYFYGDPCVTCNGKGIIDLEINDENIDFWNEIHPVIKRIAFSRFESTHFADAIESALKEINQIIKQKTKIRTGKELDGASLMMTAFSVQNPILKFNTLESQSDKDEQLGYMQLFAGTMTGIRNPKAHGNITINHLRAKHLLYLCSLLMYKIDEIIEEA